jgi:hypothetical protein
LEKGIQEKDRLLDAAREAESRLSAENKKLR